MSLNTYIYFLNGWSTLLSQLTHFPLVPHICVSESGQHWFKLDESTARRQLKSPQSLSGRSIHLTLVTKWSWSWSWMTHCHLLCAMSIGPPILRYSYFKIWPWKIHGQGHVCGQSSRSHLTFKIQRSSSNPLVTFEAWISVDMFAFHFVAIRPLLAEI